MGINSLQNYVNKHNLNLPHHLRDSKLVIYGNSFAKYLFYYLPMEYGKKSYFYGGDYADLKTYLRKLFDKFAQCNVQPIVVFDGGSKIAKALRVKHAQDHFAKRLKRAIETCESTDVNDHKFTTFDKPHWPSNTTVLFQVLRELNIAHVQCVAREADDIIPDCDFLLWDLPNGVISMKRLFEAIDFTWLSSSTDYFECTVYYRDSGFMAHLKSNYDCKRKMLPLLGPLLGYDLVDNQISMRFVGHAKQNQLNKLIPPFKEQIRLKLEEYSTNFEHLIVYKRFVQSILGQISIDGFSSVSESELRRVEQSLVNRLEEVHRNQEFSNIQCKLNEIVQQFIEELKPFRETPNTTNDKKFYPWHTDRVPAVFRVSLE